MGSVLSAEMGVISVKNVKDMDSGGFGLSTKGGMPSRIKDEYNVSVKPTAGLTIVIHLVGHQHVVSANGRHVSWWLKVKSS